MSISIRPAIPNDLSAVVSIYNQAIEKKGQTADLELLKEEDRADWFTEHLSGSYPILVATEDDLVIGWITLSPYREGRRALARTVEVSSYIAQSHIGRGVGSDMMQCIIEIARILGYQNMIGILIATNEKSIGLVRKFGFELWGTLPDIVEIDGKQFDHRIYGRKLN